MAKKLPVAGSFRLTGRINGYKKRKNTVIHFTTGKLNGIDKFP